jgi:hypothetical protein
MPPWINVLTIALLTAIWTYNFLKIQHRNRMLEKKKDEAEEEWRQLAGIIASGLIPFLEAYGKKKSSEIDEDLESEHREILMASYGIDYWGANYFEMDGYLFHVKGKNNDFSILNVAENTEFLKRIQELKDLLAKGAEYSTVYFNDVGSVGKVPKRKSVTFPFRG